MVKLDVGCGYSKTKGYVGIDKRKGVDIEHDLCEFPWPLKDNSCSHIKMNLVWGCIEPKYRIALMDEMWRIASDDCVLDIIEAHDMGPLSIHDPSYYSGANDYTFLYFCPYCDKYKVYKPKPWGITKYYTNFSNIISVKLFPIKGESKNDTTV